MFPHVSTNTKFLEGHKRKEEGQSGCIKEKHLISIRYGRRRGIKRDGRRVWTLLRKR